jgi:hypothetical protein
MTAEAEDDEVTARVIDGWSRRMPFVTVRHEFGLAGEISCFAELPDERIGIFTYDSTAFAFSIERGRTEALSSATAMDEPEALPEACHLMVQRVWFFKPDDSKDDWRVLLYGEGDDDGGDALAILTFPRMDFLCRRSCAELAGLPTVYVIDIDFSEGLVAMVVKNTEGPAGVADAVVAADVQRTDERPLSQEVQRWRLGNLGVGAHFPASICALNGGAMASLCTLSRDGTIRVWETGALGGCTREFGRPVRSAESRSRGAVTRVPSGLIDEIENEIIGEARVQAWMRGETDRARVDVMTSLEGTLSFWNSRTGERVYCLHNHLCSGSVEWIALDPESLGGVVLQFNDFVNVEDYDECNELVFWSPKEGGALIKIWLPSRHEVHANFLFSRGFLVMASTGDGSRCHVIGPPPDGGGTDLIGVRCDDADIPFANLTCDCSPHEAEHWKVPPGLQIVLADSYPLAAGGPDVLPPPRVDGPIVHRCGACRRCLPSKHPRCARCHQGRYCDALCQKKAWKRHKNDCNAKKFMDVFLERNSHLLSEPDLDSIDPATFSLRFVVGDRVECNIGEGRFVPGGIIKLWYEEDGRKHPYQICLDSGQRIFSKIDNDAAIRRAPSAPSATPTAGAT